MCTQPQDGTDQRRGDIKVSKHGNTWILDVGVVGTQRYVDQGSGTTPGLAAERSNTGLSLLSKVVAHIGGTASPAKKASQFMMLDQFMDPPEKIAQLCGPGPRAHVRTRVRVHVPSGTTMVYRIRTLTRRIRTYVRVRTYVVRTYVLIMLCHNFLIGKGH